MPSVVVEGTHQLHPTPAGRMETKKPLKNNVQIKETTKPKLTCRSLLKFKGGAVCAGRWEEVLYAGLILSIGILATHV